MLFIPKLLAPYYNQGYIVSEAGLIGEDLGSFDNFLIKSAKAFCNPVVSPGKHRWNRN